MGQACLTSGQEFWPAAKQGRDQALLRHASKGAELPLNSQKANRQGLHPLTAVWERERERWHGTGRGRAEVDFGPYRAAHCCCRYKGSNLASSVSKEGKLSLLYVDVDLKHRSSVCIKLKC